MATKERIHLRRTWFVAVLDGLLDGGEVGSDGRLDPVGAQLQVAVEEDEAEGAVVAAAAAAVVVAVAVVGVTVLTTMMTTTTTTTTALRLKQLPNTASAQPSTRMPRLTRRAMKMMNMMAAMATGLMGRRLAHTSDVEMKMLRRRTRTEMQRHLPSGGRVDHR